MPKYVCGICEKVFVKFNECHRHEVMCEKDLTQQLVNKVLTSMSNKLPSYTGELIHDEDLINSVVDEDRSWLRCQNDGSLPKHGQYSYRMKFNFYDMQKCIDETREFIEKEGLNVRIIYNDSPPIMRLCLHKRPTTN